MLPFFSLRVNHWLPSTFSAFHDLIDDASVELLGIGVVPRPAEPLKDAAAESQAASRAPSKPEPAVRLPAFEGGKAAGWLRIVPTVREIAWRL